jgi:hypothetical protein
MSRTAQNGKAFISPTLIRINSNTGSKYCCHAFARLADATALWLWQRDTMSLTKCNFGSCLVEEKGTIVKCRKVQSINMKHKKEELRCGKRIERRRVMHQQNIQWT